MKILTGSFAAFALLGVFWSAPAAGQTVTVSLVSPQNGIELLPGTPVSWTITANVSQANNAGLALLSINLIQNPTNPIPFDIPAAQGVPVGMESFSRPAGVSNPGEGGASSGYVGVQRGLPGAKNLVQIGGGQNTTGCPGSTIGTNANVVSGVGQSPAQLIAQGAFPAPATQGTYVFSVEGAVANVLAPVEPPPQPPDFWPVIAATVVLGSPSFSFTVGDATPCTLGDVNDDDVVDGKDIQPFITVFLNPGGVSPQQFCATDMTEDEVLDNYDIVAFVAVLLGLPQVSCTVSDVNDDGAIDGRDIQPFISVLLNPAGATPQQLCAADCDENGLVNMNDVGPFVGDLLGTGG